VVELAGPPSVEPSVAIAACAEEAVETREDDAAVAAMHFRPPVQAFATSFLPSRARFNATRPGLPSTSPLKGPCKKSKRKNQFEGRDAR
jgi:hypothetical protein